jgi:hypothetical protein
MALSNELVDQTSVELCVLRSVLEALHYTRRVQDGYERKHRVRFNQLQMLLLLTATSALK